MLDDDLTARMTEWRRHLHANPELSFEEAETARWVSEQLTAMGIEHETGIGGHGIVATLSRPGGNRSVGLRADMDALPIEEMTGAAHASTKPGVMHACGHDGHTTALLGAAELLAKDQSWQGTVRLIFQPAEERGGGAIAMLEDGLMERFPMDRSFAFHNWPGLPTGSIAVNEGPVFASGGRFDIVMRGTAGHAAFPHQCRDTVLAAAQCVVALQGIVSRAVDPLAPAVVTVATIHGGTAGNQIPGEVKLHGTIRTYSLEVRAKIAEEMTRIAEGVAMACGVTAEVDIAPGGIPCINDPRGAEIAAGAAEAIGAPIVRDLAPVMGGDDMGRILERAPGCYVRIGNGPAGKDGELHGPGYDFNDEILPVAAGWFAAVAKRGLAED